MSGAFYSRCSNKKNLYNNNYNNNKYSFDLCKIKRDGDAEGFLSCGRNCV